MQNPSQRARDAIKGNLDRRYALRSDVELLDSALSNMVEQLDRRALQTEVQGEEIELLSARIALLEAELERVRDTLGAMHSKANEMGAVVNSVAELLGDGTPRDLRRIVMEAHRLAREGALAIEQLLQADLLVRRDIDAATGVSTTLDST